jgi:glycerol-3-phosphate acyltransferase PlsY
MLSPAATAIAAGLFLITVLVTRYISLGSIAASLALPPAAWLTGEPHAVVLSAIGSAALILFRHRSNWHRLRTGTERRMGA